MYGPAPPLADAVSIALPPGQTVPDVVLAFTAVGCVNVKICEEVHPLESVATTVYVPAVRLFEVCPGPPEGDHAKVNGADPPLTDMVAEPSLDPLQLIPTVATLEVIWPGCMI